MNKGAASRVALISLALVALTGVDGSTLPSSNPVPSAPSQEEMIRAVTYDEIRPYLEARYVYQDGRPYLCGEDNFANVGGEPLHGWIAKQAVDHFWSAGGRLDRFWRDAYPDGESPWGAFKEPEMREYMLPYIRQAKKELIVILREQASVKTKNRKAGS